MKEYTYKMNPLKSVVSLRGDTITLNVINISYIDFNRKTNEIVVFMKIDGTNQSPTIDLSLDEFLKIKDDILNFEIEIKEYR